MTDDSTRSQAVAAFRYVVDVDGERQAAFTECTLPVVEWDVERVSEGGLNTYVHQLPSRRKFATITLKNGIGKSALLEWFQNSMWEKFSRKTVAITLLDSQQNPVRCWNIQNACPLKLTGPQLKSDSNAIAIETMELLCGEITLE